MVITEISLFKLNVGLGNAEFKTIIRKAIEVQDQWIRQNQPHLLQDKPYQHHSSYFLYPTLPGRSTLFITAPWDDPETHYSWIRSQDSKVFLSKLSRFLSEEDDSTSILHMNPARASDPELRGDLFAQNTPFGLIRITCKPREVVWMQQWFLGVVSQARDLNPDARVWGGWRLEEDDMNTEELYIFWNQKVLDGRLDSLLSVAGITHDIWLFQNVE
ncbi:hypothetical protein BGZ63DRAFT_424514 [Mariannaea sp. PMI_226]|nr:hypothetical protein BGZ63DRAFT_424514 [Mariannaea sp. PMI_226]